MSVITERIYNYEIGMIVTPDATEEELSSIIDKVNTLITDSGGSVKETDIRGVKRMLYPIKKFREGLYVFQQFSVESNKVSVFNNHLNINQSVLRYLITRL